jgi:3-methyl-2-oxobutanoate hydroxymethyltransferase
VLDLTARLTDAGIPVMGHLGLTPQSVNQFGGYRVQGRGDEQAHRIVQDAKDLEAAGVFALVLEAVPANLAEEVTAGIAVPTIGIGAGPHCDGQVLVYHDFLGITSGKLPKFVKRYASVGDEIKRAARQFAADVADGTYPAPEHSYE